MTAPWPPFSSDTTDLVCPACGEDDVRVRSKEVYYDTDPVDAFCASCRALLEVTATVVVEFSDPEVVEAAGDATGELLRSPPASLPASRNRRRKDPRG